MLTRKNFNQYINLFLEEIKKSGIEPTRIVLFGSYAKGNVHGQSDIDLAIWADAFTGSIVEDCMPFQNILTRFPLVQLQTYQTGETEMEDPFIREILSTGKDLSLQYVDFSFV